MVNKEFRLPGKEIVVRVGNGFYVFCDRSGIGKTYFAELVKSLIHARLLNAKVIPLVFSFTIKNFNILSWSSSKIGNILLAKQK